MAGQPPDSRTNHETLEESLPAIARSAPRKQPDPAPGTLGRYPVVGELGAGGMGKIYQVSDSELGRKMAAKVIKPGRLGEQAVARFVQEARLTGQLEHPNIVPVHGLEQDADGQVFFTMKQVQGTDLGTLLEQMQRPPDESSSAPSYSLPQLLQVFLKICDAIDYAHNRGVIHRDLKPQNVMIGPFGEVLVMDWGLAKVIDDPDASCDRVFADSTSITEVGESETLEGEIKGTPAFMPPEQAAGKVSELDQLADIYSLGAILYNLLTLRIPFEEETIWAVIARVTEGLVVPPSRRAPERQVPPELEAVVLKAMALEPGDRYQSVAQLRRDIEAFLEGRLVQAARYSRWSRLKRWASRHKPAIAALLAVLITVGAALIQRWHAHRGQVGAARTAVDALDPLTLLKRSDELLAGAPEGSEPLPAQIERYSAQLERLQTLADRLRAWTRLDPDDRVARDQLTRTLLALGDLARLARNDALAKFAYGDAGAEQKLADLEQSLARRRRRRHERVATLLADAAGGKLEREQAYREALIRLSSFRGRATVEQLTVRLRQLTEQRYEGALQKLVSVEAPLPWEQRRGGRRLEGLGAAAGRWLERVREGHVPDPTPPLVVEGQERLQARARHAAIAASKNMYPPWSRQLGFAQRAVLARQGPGGVRLLHLICEALGQLDDPRGAVEALTDYLRVEWEPLRAVPAGMALVRLSRLDPRAERALTRLVGLGVEGKSKWPMRGPFWQQVGRALGKQPPTARSDEAEPRSAAQFRDRGLLRAARRDFAGALADFDRAVRLAPKDPIHYHNRANVRAALRQHDLALADYASAVRLAPSHPDARIARADLYRKLGRHKEALLDYHKALELGPRKVEAHLALSRCLAEMGRLATALQVLDVARRVSSDVRIPVRRGAVLLALGRREEGMAELTRAIQLDRTNPLAYLNRAYGWLQMSRPERAIEDATRAIQLDPKSVQAHVNRGAAHSRRGDREAARRDYDRAIALGPERPDAWFARGGHWLAVKDYRRALVDLGKGLALAPRDGSGRNKRIASYYYLGRYEEALADCRVRLKQNPRDWNTTFLLGMITEKTRGPRAALPLLEKAIGLAPPWAVSRIKPHMERVKRKVR